MDRSYSAGPGEMSIPFLVDEKPTVVTVGSAGERSGGARKVPYGLHWQTVLIAQIVWNRSTRRAGATRPGAVRQAQMGKDFVDHRPIFDRGDDLQVRRYNLGSARYRTV